ncbi:MAG: hypothetical protein ACTSQF_05575 [Candidatus Heimdallarchaeaceae archaeon]
MSEEKKVETLIFELDLNSILETVGNWFDSKMIHYSDDMFSDYFENVKAKLLSSETLDDYLKLRIDELIFKLLSVYHEKKKQSYEEVTEEEEELVPAWFLTERYNEIEEMFRSKFLSHTFAEVETEYDSVMKKFTITLHLDKEVDKPGYDVLINDIQSYLKNRITLLNFNQGKIISPFELEIVFGIDW